jgi:hypothetical protein
MIVANPLFPRALPWAHVSRPVGAKITSRLMAPLVPSRQVSIYSTQQVQDSGTKTVSVALYLVLS